MKDLKYFIQKQQVIQQYRSFMRIIQSLKRNGNIEMAKDVKNHVEYEFRRHKTDLDPSQIDYLLRYGDRELKFLQQLIK